jgi:hypothetical protein
LEEARRIIEEYAADLRAIIRRLRRKLNWLNLGKISRKRPDVDRLGYIPVSALTTPDPG